MIKMQGIHRICLLISLYLFSFKTFSQGSIQFQAINSDRAAVFKNIKFKSAYSSLAEIQSDLKSTLTSLHNNGYILASLDSSLQDAVSYKAYIVIGNNYKWGHLSPAKGSENILAETGYRERFYTKTAFSPKEISRLFDKILSWCENNGYPFATVKLDSVRVQDESVYALLNIHTNKFIRLDSIIVSGTATISKNFIQHYFQVKEGMPYNEQNLKKIGQKVKQLPFIKETKAQLVRITDKHTKLYLFFDKKNASQFDGIIGLLPNATGQTIFTGDVRIKLQNTIFKAGELVDLNWRRLQSQTQDLKLQMAYPYLFNSPVGTDYTLKIYRRDTSFVDIQNNIGLQYIFNGLNNIKVFYKQRNANLLSTSGLETATTLPDYADIFTTSYGLGVNYEKLDYKFNPRRGISIAISASAGNRQIKKNARLNPAIYSNLKLNSPQYQSEAIVNAYIPLFKRSAVKLGAQFGSVYSNQIFKNELFRMGGLKTLRGVDEESIFASTYTITSIEYRFLFEQNSAIYLFSDAAWYENNSVKTYITDVPYSLGAGISFETKVGIFSLNYALGKQFNNSLDIRAGKIHFGIVNSF